MPTGPAFTWDPRKSLENQRKHGISFEEAQSVFFDESARLIEDPDHSDHEERFIMLGISTFHRILTVIHCYREDDDIIHIISARKATKNETSIYQGRIT
jgi:uncharacterized protein